MAIFSAKNCGFQAPQGQSFLKEEKMLLRYGNPGESVTL